MFLYFFAIKLLPLRRSLTLLLGRLNYGYLLSGNSKVKQCPFRDITIYKSIYGRIWYPVGTKTSL